ncbi:MAG: hypothetical protein IPO37_23580 [Saprospiraceae bacterium]|jgi:hypothetical protein|nr:hypothetical protein [Saprospiraceae bacterium]
MKIINNYSSQTRITSDNNVLNGYASYRQHIFSTWKLPASLEKQTAEKNILKMSKIEIAKCL